MYDLIVLGGGPAGYNAAERAGHAGLKTLVIEESDSFEVHRAPDGVFELSGTAIDKLLDAVNFESEDSLNYFHRMLRRMGAIDELRAKGAKEGSTVRIYEMEFDFVE